MVPNFQLSCKETHINHKNTNKSSNNSLQKKKRKKKRQDNRVQNISSVINLSNPSLALVAKEKEK